MSTHFLPLPLYLCVQDAGFSAEVNVSGKDHSGLDHKVTIRKWRLTFCLALVTAIPAMIVALLPIHWHVIVPGLTIREAILFPLAAIVQVCVCVCAIESYRLANHCKVSMVAKIRY